MSNFEKVHISSRYYPKNLKLISNPPQDLYIKGDLNTEYFDKCISIVGTRHPTEYGKRVTRDLVNTMCLNQIICVSGFMYGIDMIVHKTCVDNNCKTIAILPYGINKKVNNKLNSIYEGILKSGGLVISEYPGNEEPQKWMFVKRNRIVSGISNGVVITEASLNSGSLTTAKIAQEQNKNLYAICGHIDCEVSKGVNFLIKQNKANMLNDFEELAVLYNNNVSNSNKNFDTKKNKNSTHIKHDKKSNFITCLEKDTKSTLQYEVEKNTHQQKDVSCNCSLKDTNISINKHYKKTSIQTSQNVLKNNLNKNEKLVFKKIRVQHLNIDQLISKTNLSIQDLNVILSNLMIKGLVHKVGGNYYVS